MKPQTPAVLVVDDDAAVRKLIATVLRARGYAVFEAQNGLEAVQVFGSYHSDIALVITDLEMPGLNGLEAILRMQEIDGSVPVLIVSGRSDGIPRLAGRPRLSKPFTPNQLLALVEQALGRAR